MITRRDVMKLTAGAALNAGLGKAQTPSIAAGPFRGARTSLASYRVPEWFRDAKFGI